MRTRRNRETSSTSSWVSPRLRLREFRGRTGPTISRDFTEPRAASVWSMLLILSGTFPKSSTRRKFNPHFGLRQSSSAFLFRTTLREYLPLNIFLSGSTTIRFASRTGICWSNRPLEHHAHFRSLSGREAKFPVHFEIDILFRGRILDDKISSFNHLRCMANLFEVDLEN